MKLQKFATWSRLACLSAAAAVVIGATGCQTNLGGQVLPSAYYLHDDIQYFPVGPEDKIFNERRALEQYKAERQSVRAGLDEKPAPNPPNP